jgi:FkbM family methyltransferase
MTTDQIITHEFQSHKFYFNNTPDAPALIAEIFADNYHVLNSKMEFRPDDVILDLGANEGMFSILLSKLFPLTRIISLEPVPRTYFQLVRNIGLNACTNISAYNAGVGKPGQHTSTLNVSKDFSGGSTSLCEYNPDHHFATEVNVMSMDEIFQMYKIERCRLLKMDVEGVEYEVLYPCTILPLVDFMVFETHMNRKLEYAGRRMDGLINWVSNRTQLLHVELCKMAE